MSITTAEWVEGFSDLVTQFTDGAITAEVFQADLAALTASWSGLESTSGLGPALASKVTAAMNRLDSYLDSIDLIHIKAILDETTDLPAAAVDAAEGDYVVVLSNQHLYVFIAGNFRDVGPHIGASAKQIAISIGVLEEGATDAQFIAYLRAPASDASAEAEIATAAAIAATEDAVDATAAATAKISQTETARLAAVAATTAANTATADAIAQTALTYEAAGAATGAAAAANAAATLANNKAGLAAAAADNADAVSAASAAAVAAATDALDVIIAEAAETAETAATLLAAAEDILDGIPSLGFTSVAVPTLSDPGTALGSFPPGFTYTLLNDASGKVELSAGLPVLADEGPATPDTFTYVVEATPTNGGQVLKWAIKVQFTLDLADLVLSTYTFPIEAMENELVATITGKTAGSVIEFLPNDGRYYVDGSGVYKGPSAVTTGAIAGTLRESLVGARNSPHDSDCDPTVTKAFDYYLDTVGGSDSNDGSTPFLAFLSPTPLNAGVMTTGKKLGIRGRSRPTSKLNLAADSLIVKRYGPAGEGKPILDDSRVLTGFTATAGRTNVWQTPLQSFTDAKHYGNIFKDGAFIPQAASLPLCESTPGTCFVSDWNTPAPTLYLNSTVDPDGDGHVYRQAYDSALSITGAGVTIEDLQTERNSQQDGSTRIAGENATVRRMVIQYGSRHAAYFGAGCLIEDCEMTAARNDTESGQAANLAVINQTSILGKSYVTRRNIMSAGGQPAVSAWSNHGGNPADLFASIRHEDETYIDLAGVNTIAAVDEQMVRPIFSNVRQCGTAGVAGATWTVSDGTGTLNRMFEATAGVTINSTGNTVTVPLLGDTAPGFYRVNTATSDVTLNISGDTLSIVLGQAVSSQIIRHQRGAITCYDSTFKPAGGRTLCADVDDVIVAGFGGGGNVATYTGDRNVFPYGSRFTLNGTAYNTLAAWQAFGKDPNSTVQQPKTPTAVDAFTRADENLEATNWTRLTGTAAQGAVRSNQMAAIGTSATAYRRASLASPNGYVRCKIKGVPATAGPVLAMRIGDSSNWLGVRWSSGAGFQIGKCVAGVNTVAVAGPGLAVTPAIDQDIILAFFGDRVWLYVDGRCVTRGQAFIEPALAANTGAGVVIRNTVVNPWLDDFSCGDL